MVSVVMRYGFALFIACHKPPVERVRTHTLALALALVRTKAARDYSFSRQLERVRDRNPVYRVPYTGFRFLHDILQSVDRFCVKSQRTFDIRRSMHQTHPPYDVSGLTSNLRILVPLGLRRTTYVALYDLLQVDDWHDYLATPCQSHTQLACHPDQPDRASTIVQAR